MHQVRRERPVSILSESRFCRRRLMAGCLGLGLAGLTAGFLPSGRGMRTARGAAEPGTFTALMAYGLEDLDPHSTYGAYGPLFNFGVYERLIKYSGAGVDGYAPMLAQSWEVSDDQSTYTFNLAPDALFHDGVPCDAQAVKTPSPACSDWGWGRAT